MDYILVEDLLEQLKNVNPKARIAVLSNNYQHGSNKVHGKGIITFTGKIARERFYCNFDGTNYSQDVVKFEEDGPIDFVQIV
jgi:hypothetical protein